jgi:hypothetical protein
MGFENSYVKIIFSAFNNLWLCYKLVIWEVNHNMAIVQKMYLNINPTLSQEFDHA